HRERNRRVVVVVGEDGRRGLTRVEDRRPISNKLYAALTNLFVDRGLDGVAELARIHDQLGAVLGHVDSTAAQIRWRGLDGGNGLPFGALCLNQLYSVLDPSVRGRILSVFGLGEIEVIVAKLLLCHIRSPRHPPEGEADDA